MTRHDGSVAATRSPGARNRVGRPAPPSVAGRDRLMGSPILDRRQTCIYRWETGGSFHDTGGGRPVSRIREARSRGAGGGDAAPLPDTWYGSVFQPSQPRKNPYP